MFADSIELVQDIDGDGLSEVVVSYTDGGQGEFHTEAKLIV